MPKIKQARVAIRIDMTPMVDVAFLLLTFFMLTTQFRPPEDTTIELPLSHSAVKLPESDVMILTLTKDSQIWLGVDAQPLRVKLFGPENILRTSMQVEQKDLSDLLIRARIANPRLRTVVKCDKATSYAVIEDVMKILEDVKISRFNLVTDLERD
jgi:biopolymer transport protein ExbD